MGSLDDNKGLAWGRMIIGSAMVAGIVYLQYVKGIQIQHFVWGFPGILLAWDKLEQVAKILSTLMGRNVSPSDPK